MSNSSKSNPLVELLITLIIPSVILMKLSGEDDLGAVYALLLALSLPLSWGVWDFIVRRKLNPFAALGLVSILLTGSIGVLQLDTQWLAIKEAAIPGLIGVAVFVSAHTRYPDVDHDGGYVLPGAFYPHTCRFEADRNHLAVSLRVLAPAAVQGSLATNAN